VAEASGLQVKLGNGSKPSFFGKQFQKASFIALRTWVQKQVRQLFEEKSKGASR